MFSGALTAWRTAQRATAAGLRVLLGYTLSVAFLAVWGYVSWLMHQAL